jgi:ferredoxin-type protein NapH
MKRQNIRKALILISFLLFPVTIYYLSPYLIIMGAAEGIITGSFIVFIFMFLVSLFFGRAYCGWACAPGGLQECCTMVSSKRAKGRRLNYIKYIIWIIWISIIAAVFVNAGGIKKIDFLYMTDHGISVTAPQAYIIFYFVIMLIVVLALTAGKRSFCHYVCWMAPFMILGNKLRNKLNYPSLHLKVKREECISCSACTKKCPMSLEVMEMVQRGNMYNSECILCGECVDGCPKKVISYGIKK